LEYCLAQTARLLSATNKKKMYELEYVVKKPQEQERHLLSVVALGFNGVLFTHLYLFLLAGNFLICSFLLATSLSVPSCRQLPYLFLLAGNFLICSFLLATSLSVPSCRQLPYLFLFAGNFLICSFLLATSLSVPSCRQLPYFSLL
jgi:PsbP